MVDKESIPVLQTLTYNLFSNAADITQALELTNLNETRKQIAEIQ
jgi:hypothetical protein